MADLLRGGQIGAIGSASTGFRSGSGQFGRRALLGGKDTGDEGPLSWARHALVVLAIMAAVFYLFFQQSASTVNLDDYKSLSSAMQSVDSEWHRAQKLHEELRQERSKLLQVLAATTSVSEAARGSINRRRALCSRRRGCFLGYFLSFLSFLVGMVCPGGHRPGRGGSGRGRGG